jgi:hypothetical protein
MISCSKNVQEAANRSLSLLHFPMTASRGSTASTAFAVKPTLKQIICIRI